jgi:hypothetical protein
MGVPLPEGPSPIFSLPPAIFRRKLRLAIFKGIAARCLEHGAVFRHFKERQAGGKCLKTAWEKTATRFFIFIKQIAG